MVEKPGTENRKQFLVIFTFSVDESRFCSESAKVHFSRLTLTYS